MLKSSTPLYELTDTVDSGTEEQRKARENFSLLIAAFRARNKIKLNDFKDWSAVRPGYRVHNSQVSCLQNPRNEFVPKDSFWIGLGRFNQDIAENNTVDLLPDLVERLTAAQPICLADGSTAQAHELWGMFNGGVEIPAFWLKPVVTQAHCLEEGRKINEQFLAFVAAKKISISAGLDQVSSGVTLPKGLEHLRPTIEQILLGIVPPHADLIEGGVLDGFDDLLKA